MPHYIPISLLVVSIICMWFKPRYLWLIPFVGFVASGIISQWIEPISMFSIVIFYGTVLYYQHADSSFHRSASFLVIIIAAVAYASNVVDGFNTIEVFKNTWITPNKNDVTVRYNANAAVVGVLLLSCFRDQLITNTQQLLVATRNSFLIIFIGLIVIYSLGLLIGYLRFDPAFHSIVLPLFISNLFFVVLAEEMLFRGVVQTRLIEYIKHPMSVTIGLVITSILFGLLHVGGGWKLAFLATLAGMLYGYVYIRTGRLEMAIAAHIALNAFNAILFYAV